MSAAATSPIPTVIALADRRIDAEGAATERFSLEAVESVAAALDALFAMEHAVALVSSAACGADLIALEVAGRKGLRRRIVLPSAPKEFLRTSVIDRSGGWGSSFANIIDEVRGKGDLVIVIPPPDRNDPYHFASEAIIAEACRTATELGPRTRKVAVVVWEGQPRHGSDVTEYFRRTALAKGLELREILTLPRAEPGPSGE
jgi:hypothetical protein